MKIRIFIATVAIGVCASVVIKLLTFPTHAFLVLDLVAGTNLNGSSPGIWQRVIANPIYFAVAMGIGFVAEFFSGYLVAILNHQRVGSVLLLAFLIIATHFAINFDHPIMFNLMMVIRVLVASYSGFFYYVWRMKKTTNSLGNMPPIARPH